MRISFNVVRRAAAGWVIAVAALLAAGCGGGGAGDQPELGQVSGVVTLDGQPLPNATVEFSPEQGRPSIGKTDEEGHYELQYTQDETGAKIGPHKVRIRTFDYATPDAAERVPAKYNEQTELTADVTPGSNTIPFELESN